MVKDVYMMKIDGRWHGFMPRPRCSMIFSAEKGMDLTDFYAVLKEDFAEMKIDARFRCIYDNRGMERRIMVALGKQPLPKPSGFRGNPAGR